MNIDKDCFFRKIDDIKSYAESIKDDIIYAKKTKCVKARQGLLDEVVNSYTNGILETTNKVKVGSDGKLGWVLNNIDNDDTFWIVGNEYFIKNYDHKENDIYMPKETINKFVKVNEDISFKVSWGEMNLKKGGYLKITDLSNIVAIQENDFLNTYEIIDKR